MDLEAFIEWIRKAAEQGEPVAEYELGYAYVEGNGVPKKMDEAVAWFRRCAEQGSPLGQVGLGTAYAKGDAGERDLIEAYKWFLLAAAQGQGVARDQLQNLARRLTLEEIVEAKKRADAFKPRRPGPAPKPIL